MVVIVSSLSEKVNCYLCYGLVSFVRTAQSHFLGAMGFKGDFCWGVSVTEVLRQFMYWTCQP